MKADFTRSVFNKLKHYLTVSEIPFDEGVWRVIRTEDGDNGTDQTAVCRIVESDD